MIEVLKQSEIGLTNLISYQSTPNKPTIHEYGQAVRALSMVRKAIQEQALRNVQRIGQEIEQELVSPDDESICEDRISASDSEGVAYDGPSFERGYKLGQIAERDAVRPRPEIRGVRSEFEAMFATPPAQPAPVPDLHFFKQVLSVAIAGLFEHYKGDVLKTFSTDELQKVVNLSESLRPRQVEDIYRQMWDMLETPPAQPAPAPEHPDDWAVDRFAAAMKAKLAKQRAKGYGDWDDPKQCSGERLQTMLADHLGKGDPVDVGNFAMMLWNRGEKTAQPAPAEPLTDVVKAAKGVLEWTEIAHRPPKRDRLEGGRMPMVRVHALADLHDALEAHGIATKEGGDQ